MRRLAKAAIAFTVLFSDQLMPPGLTAFAQATTQSTTNTAAAAYNNSSDNRVLQILSAAQNDEVRILLSKERRNKTTPENQFLPASASHRPMPTKTTA